MSNPNLKTPLLLIGGGGHCRSCIDVIDATEGFEIVGIVESDNYQFNKNASKSNLTPYPIVGRDADLPSLIMQTPHCLITLGQIKSAATRIKIFNKLKSLGAIFPTIISPSARVSATAEIGEGTIVMHQALINAYSNIGANCIVNSQALIEHDCVIGNHSHISTASKLNGSVQIGEGCMIGSATAVKQEVVISDEVVIGINSTVLSDINQPGVYVGLIK